MRIEPRKTIADVPMLRVRNLLQWLRDYRVDATATDIGQQLDLERSQADTLIAELLQRRLLAPSERDQRRQEPHYKLTSHGSRIAAANASKPLKRATAERILKEFQARIEVVNQDTYYLYRVSRVVLFGSFLSDVPTLSDVDLIVHLEPKASDSKLHMESCIKRNHEFLQRGWCVGYETLWVFYETLAKREVLVALRNRSAYLSLHSFLDEVLIQGQPHRVIYGPEEYVIPTFVRECYGFDDDLDLEGQVEFADERATLDESEIDRIRRPEVSHR